MRKERNINTKGQSVEKENEWRELAWLSIQDTYEDCTSTYSSSVFKLALMSHFTVICPDEKGSKQYQACSLSLQSDSED